MVSALALALAAPAASGGEGILLRLRLRAGDEWRERVLHEVEALGPGGERVWGFRSERVETVRVLSLLDAPGAAGRWARVRRSPEPAPAGGAVRPPYNVLVSSRGEIAMPPPAEGVPAVGAERARLMASLVSRYAPILPEDALAVGGSAMRTIRMRFAPCAGRGAEEAALAETETATLVSATMGRGGGPGVAAFVLRRRAGPQRVPLMEAALAAPGRGALVAAVSTEDLGIELLGAAGDGELRVDPVGGAVLSYVMHETLGLGARLGRTSVRRTLNVRFEVERLGPVPADARSPAGLRPRARRSRRELGGPHVPARALTVAAAPGE